MAYGIKYRMTGGSVIFGNTFQLDIYIRDYSGAITAIKGSGDPIILDLDSESENKFTAIKGSTMTVEIIEESIDQFIEFNQYDSRYSYAILYYDSVEKWRGWYDSEGFQQPYLYPPYKMQLLFRCGLGSLKNVDFEQGDRHGTPWYNYSIPYQNQYSLLVDILSQTGFSLNTLDLYEALNVYEDAHLKTNSDSPLSQTYQDYLAYYPDKNGSYASYYDVLSDMMKMYGARIYQWEGAWHIERVNDLKDTFVRRRYVNSIYDSVETTYSDQKTLTNSSAALANLCVFIDHSQYKSWIPGYRRFTTIQDQGLKDQVIWNNFGLDWLVANNQLPPKWTDDFQSKTLTAEGLRINAISNVYILKTAEVDLGQYDLNEYKAKFSFSAKCIQDVESNDNYFRVQLIGVWNGFTYYCDSDGIWSTATKDLIYHNPATDGFDVNVSLDIETLNIDGLISITGVVDYTLIIYQYIPSGTNDEGDYILISNNGIMFTVEKNEQLENENDITTQIDRSNTYVPDDRQVGMGDLPGNIYSRYLYLNGLYYESGGSYYPTDNWNRRGETDNERLLDIVNGEIISSHQYPSEKLYGVLITDIGFGTIIYDTNTDKYYLIDNATWNVKHDRWETALLEISTGGGMSFLATEEGDGTEYVETEESTGDEFMELNN
jgi:hypothetical protein